MDIKEYKAHRNALQRQYYAKRKLDPVFIAKRRESHRKWLKAHPDKNKENSKKYYNSKTND